MSDMRSLIEKLTAIAEDRPSVGDGVYLEFGNILQVDTEIMEMSNDSITLLGDEKILELLESLKQIEESAISSKTLSNYIEKASDARKHRKLPTHKVDNRYAGVHKADKILTARSKETVKEEDDDKHGSPYDRGRADSYYGRRHNPHKLVPNAHGGHEHEKLTDPIEVEAYSKGYRENTDKKDYGESVDEGEVVSLHGNPQNLKRLVKMWWNGSQDQHAQAAKMIDNMGWDIDEDDDDVVLTKGDEEIRFFMDDLYEEMVSEAEYHGRKVPLGKPMRGDVAKKKVYVKDPKTGNVKKINFGQKGVKIKKNNPARRKSFRARHNCKTAKDRTTARYWSCRAW